LPRPAICDDDRIHFRDRRLPIAPPARVQAHLRVAYRNYVEPEHLADVTLWLPRQVPTLYYAGNVSTPAVWIDLLCWLNPIVAEFNAGVAVTFEHGHALAVSDWVLPVTANNPLTWFGHVTRYTDGTWDVDLTLSYLP
jgi:hypothetical protein